VSCSVSHRLRQTTASAIARAAIIALRNLHIISGFATIGQSKPLTQRNKRRSEESYNRGSSQPDPCRPSSSPGRFGETFTACRGGAKHEPKAQSFPNLDAGQSDSRAARRRCLRCCHARSGAYQLTALTTDDNANLTSLGFPAAANVDPNLVNPWGI